MAIIGGETYSFSYIFFFYIGSAMCLNIFSKIYCGVGSNDTRKTKQVRPIFNSVTVAFNMDPSKCILHEKVSEATPRNSLLQT